MLSEKDLSEKIKCVSAKIKKPSDQEFMYGDWVGITLFNGECFCCGRFVKYVDDDKVSIVGIGGIEETHFKKDMIKFKTVTLGD